jgi:hypothetical protein
MNLKSEFSLIKKNGWSINNITYLCARRAETGEGGTPMKNKKQT